MSRDDLHCDSESKQLPTIDLCTDSGRDSDSSSSDSGSEQITTIDLCTDSEKGSDFGMGSLSKGKQRKRSVKQESGPSLDGWQGSRTESRASKRSASSSSEPNNRLVRRQSSDTEDDNKYTYRYRPFRALERGNSKKTSRLKCSKGHYH
jgi:hypothetical protein